MQAIVTTRRLLHTGAGHALSAFALTLALAGCGGSSAGSPGGSLLSGVVSSDASTAGTVSLKDSSAPANERTTAVDASGSFALDVTGLTAPFLLKADSEEGETARMYSVSTEGGTANINPITDTAVRASVSGEADDDYERGDGESTRRTATSFKRIITQLQTVLKPLFDLYGVPADPITSEGAAASLQAMLRDVRIARIEGKVVVTNRATGAVIFFGPLSNLASGTFYAANMPAGPGTIPPPACAYTYSAWGACQSNDTQTRTVATASPAGCTGTPVVSQACSYVPPVTTCSSFTYSAWSACQSNDTQTRTVATSSPAGCTGGTPVVSQACTYVAPLDGAALYASKCAGCHGSLATSNLKGKNISVSSIKSRNMAQGLTDAQLQAIVDVVGP